jgi:hypothetical protein
MPYQFDQAQPRDEYLQFFGSRVERLKRDPRTHEGPGICVCMCVCVRLCVCLFCFWYACIFKLIVVSTIASCCMENHTNLVNQQVIIESGPGNYEVASSQFKSSSADMDMLERSQTPFRSSEIRFSSTGGDQVTAVAHRKKGGGERDVGKELGAHHTLKYKLTHKGTSPYTQTRKCIHTESRKHARAWCLPLCS